MERTAKLAVVAIACSLARATVTCGRWQRRSLLTNGVTEQVTPPVDR